MQSGFQNKIVWQYCLQQFFFFVNFVDSYQLLIQSNRYGRFFTELCHFLPLSCRNGLLNGVNIKLSLIHIYLGQLEEMGEDRNEYESVFGYSIGETEPHLQLYEYPEYDFEVTGEMTNLELEEAN